MDEKIICEYKKKVLYLLKRNGMENRKVYQGRVESCIRIGITAFGIKQFKVGFKNGSAFFEISSKRTMPISVGETIHFTGYWILNTFYIDEVLDESHYVHSIRENAEVPGEKIEVKLES